MPRLPRDRSGRLFRLVLGFSLAGLWSTLAGCATPAAPAPAVRRAPRIAPVRPLCMVETAASADRPPRDRTFPAQNWFVLMLHAYRSTGEMARPLTDCTGTPVRIDEDGCGGGPGPLPRFTATELTQQDLVVTSLGDTTRLVWVITEHLSDGLSQGPIAIAEIEPRGISVRAIGALRTYAENVSLRLERVSGATMLVADGQRCENPGAAETCDRAIRMVPLVGDRFVQKPLVDERGVCLGSSFLPVRARGRGGRGRGHEYELETSVTFGANIVTIRESLALTRQPAGHGPRDQASESFVTRLQLERQVSLRNGRLVTDGPSLLTRWLTQQDLERE